MKNLKKLNRNELKSISGGETGAQLNIVPLGQLLGMLSGGLLNAPLCTVQCLINGEIKILNCGSC